MLLHKVVKMKSQKHLIFFKIHFSHIFTFVFILFLINDLSAQKQDTSWRARFHGGVEIGISGNDITGTNSIIEFPHSKLGWTVGANFRYTPWKGRMGLGLGVEGRQFGNEQYNILAVGFPISIDFNFWMRNRLSYFVIFGLNPGFFDIIDFKENPYSSSHFFRSSIGTGLNYKYSEEFEFKVYINRMIGTGWSDLSREIGGFYIPYRTLSMELRIGVYKNFGFSRLNPEWIKNKYE